MSVADYRTQADLWRDTMEIKNQATALIVKQRDFQELSEVVASLELDPIIQQRLVEELHKLYSSRTRR